MGAENRQGDEGRPAITIRQFNHPNDYPTVHELWEKAGTGIRLRRSDQPEEIAKKLERDPDLFLVSAGFDGHRFDPLGGFAITGDGFREIAGLLKGFADELCDGRIVSLCEGGYDPDGNVDSITNYIRGLTSQ